MKRFIILTLFVFGIEAAHCQSVCNKIDTKTSTKEGNEDFAFIIKNSFYAHECVTELTKNPNRATIKKIADELERDINILIKDIESDDGATILTYGGVYLQIIYRLQDIRDELLLLLKKERENDSDDDKQDEKQSDKQDEKEQTGKGEVD